MGGRGITGGRWVARSARLLALAATAIAAACSSGDEGGSGKVGGAQPPASAPYVTLTRDAHPLARPEFDVGPLDPAKVLHNMSLVFKPTPAQLADRDALVDEIQRPGSPVYHQWLTPAQYAARFGASAETIARATSWLAARGFTVHEPSPLGARVTFTGSVAQVNAAFQTEIHSYQVGSAPMHYAPSRAPSVPADLADSVLGIKNLHDFFPKHTKPNVMDPDFKCPNGACTGNALGPADWSLIYDVGPLYNPGLGGTAINGTNVTIAIVGVAEIAQGDLNKFRTTFGLTPNPDTEQLTVVPNTGNPAAGGGSGAGVEAILDNEWAAALAPNASIQYFYTGADDGNVNDAVFYAIEKNAGGVLSESFGGCEYGSTPADADISMTYGVAANLEGITYLAASGDDGAAGCVEFGFPGLYVGEPATLPQVTAVGGTGFAMTPSALTFNTAGAVTSRNPGPESVWNENPSGGGASTGGVSMVFPRPNYQATINATTQCPPVGTLPTGVTAATARLIPDVAFTAASGYTQYPVLIECTTTGSGQTLDCSATAGNAKVLAIGGTSASTPAFAGVVALANQAAGSRLGNINPLLYALNGNLNGTGTTSTSFHDITSGTNEVTCTAGQDGCPNGGKYGFPAKAGYDCATGLGSVDATNLVTAIKALTPTSTALTAPATTTEGANVTLNATITGAGNNPLTGTVDFAFESYLSTNTSFDLSWTLGTVNVAAGAASLTTAIPPGMVGGTGGVDVYAIYSGDAHHIGSVSPKQHITFSQPWYLCAAPATDSVAAGATINFVASGGVPPYKWYVDYDTTYDTSGNNGSNIVETTGVFTAGTGAAGYVIVQVIDSAGADTFAEITVAGGSGTVPWSTNGPANYANIKVSATAVTTCPAGDNCGTIPNGCGGTVTCTGTCTAPQTCGGGGVPNHCGGGCVPLTTCPNGQTCGTASNGCGGTINCGTCVAPETCGGGGTTNQCGCTSSGHCANGNTCGNGADNCGNTISCGTCTGNTTCGGGGVPGQCGANCLPTTCIAQGAQCGTIGDGCGGTLTCPSCGNGQSCVSNQCVSTVVDAGTDSGGGVDSGTPDAGTPDTGAPGADACVPTTCSFAFAECGMTPDGCGGMLNCGSCIGDNMNCVSNQCIAGTQPDAGSDSGGGLALPDSGTTHPDSGTHSDASAGGDASEDAGQGESGSSGGCGCRTVESTSSPSTPALAGTFGVLVLAGARMRRRKK